MCTPTWLAPPLTVTKGQNAKMSIVHVSGLKQCFRCAKGRDSAEREENMRSGVDGPAQDHREPWQSH